MKMRRKATLIFAILISVCVAAFEPMGSWRTHISYTICTRVQPVADKVYALSSGALFSVDVDEDEIRTYSKLEGLNDNNIRLISKVGDALLIAYENSNIDLLYSDGEVENISDLYRKTMSQSKQINCVCSSGDIVYLGCEFGIVAINRSKNEIGDTYIIGDDGNYSSVREIVCSPDTIYALTSEGIKFAPLKGANLLNYQNWSLLDAPSDLHGLALLGGDLYTASDGKLCCLKSNWQYTSADADSVWNEGNILFFRRLTGEVVMRYGADYSTIIPATDAKYDDRSNTLWYATNSGLYSYNLNTGEKNLFNPDGPADNSSWRIRYSNYRIYTVPGGRWAVNYFNNGSVSVYDSYNWFNIIYPDLAMASPTQRCYDLVDVIAHPDDPTHFFAASYGLGLYEFRDNKFYKLHTCDNSGLETLYPDGDRYNFMRIDGLAFDSNRRLWMLNRGDAQIKVLDENGVIRSLQHPELTNVITLQDIVMWRGNENIKFVLCPRYTSSENSMLFVFDDNGTPFDVSDDRTRVFTSLYDQDGKNLQLSAYNLRSIAQDLNGSIWLGTTQGPLLLSDIKNIFQDGYTCRRVKIARNDGTNLADYLLSTEQINSIAVDGANRKWFATESGCYLISADGTSEIHHFTSENSPLLSNSVQAVGVNDHTGEVFFGTDCGLISYQSDAIETNKHIAKARAFPNPMRQDFSGVITITGLTENTSVRITDVAGNIVYETTSNGGIATWDALRNGERVATGVYFAHCVSANRKEHAIVKILVIK